MASASWTFGNLRPDEKGLKPMPIEGAAGGATVRAFNRTRSFLYSLGFKWSATVAITVLLTTAIVAPSSIAAIDAIREMEDKNCISVSDIDAAQSAWAGAAVAIGEAWINEGCTGALREANRALDAAYTFDQDLLFKPTLTQPPDTFRRTRAEALSYFIGHCAPEGAVGTDKDLRWGTALEIKPTKPPGRASRRSLSQHDLHHKRKILRRRNGTRKNELRLPVYNVTHVVDKTFVYTNNGNKIPLIVVHHSWSEHFVRLRSYTFSPRVSRTSTKSTPMEHPNPTYHTEYNTVCGRPRPYYPIQRVAHRLKTSAMRKTPYGRRAPKFMNQRIARGLIVHCEQPIAQV